MNNYYIFTGPFGGGKSSVIKELANKNYITVKEPAREVLSVQRVIDGLAVYDKKPMFFKEWMLAKTIFDYQNYQYTKEPVFFDRAIPDVIAYSDVFNIARGDEVRASQRFNYNKRVFYFPAWQRIYMTDEDRKLDYNESAQFGENLKIIYQKLGYELIEVPCIPINERSQFILQHIDI